MTDSPRPAWTLSFKLVLLGVGLCLGLSTLVAYAADLRLARVETVEVYVTAVNADQSDIGFAKTSDGPVLGTYDLRGIDVWADGEHGEWRLVAPDVADGTPRCIPPGSYGAKVQLTLSRAVAGGKGVLDRVARLRCLAPPDPESIQR